MFEADNILVFPLELYTPKYNKSQIKMNNSLNIREIYNQKIAKRTTSQ